MLVGVWDVEISNATFLPDRTATVHARTSFEWIEDGAFLVIRQGSKASGAPYSIWFIGRDEGAEEYVALYVDDRRVSTGVSRVPHAIPRRRLATLAGSTRLLSAVQGRYQQ